MKKYYVLCALSILCTLSLVTGVQVYGMGMGSGMGTGSGMGIGSTTAMMGSTDNYGMMNGMSGSPVVGSDGTAYLLTYQLSSTSGTSSSTFKSTLSAVTLSGQKTSITLTGIVSRPVLSSDGGLLFATTSMPDMSQYNMMGNFSTSTTSLSTLYVIQLPLTQNSKLTAVSLAGNYASVPVIVNNKIYVSTTDFGGSMMGSGVVSNPQQGSSYLYIINFDGTVVSKTQM
ncbi:MAG: hypothetical protein HQK89_00160 [Nitrospirae bacterium]|nr:hypothetical protein [Nitrospirota bacterium]